MTNFLIESASCQLAFLAFYFLWLQHEKMYRFNRFYLLASIVVSFLIPFIDIEIIEEIVQPINQIETFTPIVPSAIEEEAVNYFSFIFLGIYLLILLAFASRLVLNVKSILRKKQLAEIVPIENAKLALLQQQTLPHTFLDTIFLNKNDYENHKIEDELLSHELTHVIQKHSLDVLFIETLLVIFWFNPLLYIYKKAIRLNHEFLADEKVISSCDVPLYQQLLVSKAANHQTFELASNLNYLVTKKRLIMMTKTTSKIKSMLYKLALIPVLVLLISLVCIETKAQIKPNMKPQTATSFNDGRDDYYSGVRVIVKKWDGTLIFDKKYEELSTEEKDRYIVYTAKELTKKSPTSQQFEEFKDKSKYALWIDGKSIPNSKLDNLSPNEIVYFSTSKVYKNARSKKFPQPFQTTFYTNSYFEEKLKNAHKKFSGDKIEITLGKYDQSMSHQNANQREWEKVEQILKNSTKQVAVATIKPDSNQDTQDDQIYTAVEVQPEFPGGMTAFYKYVGSSFKIPSGFKGKGKIITQFVIEKDGSLSSIKVLRDIGFNSAKETERVLHESPKWKPGMQNGKAVRVMYALPISIDN